LHFNDENRRPDDRRDNDDTGQNKTAPHRTLFHGPGHILIPVQIVSGVEREPPAHAKAASASIAFIKEYLRMVPVAASRAFRTVIYRDKVNQE
jgi:hypothetical protein